MRCRWQGSRGRSSAGAPSDAGSIGGVGFFGAEDSPFEVGPCSVVGLGVQAAAGLAHPLDPYLPVPVGACLGGVDAGRGFVCASELEVASIASLGGGAEHQAWAQVLDEGEGESEDEDEEEEKTSSSRICRRTSRLRRRSWTTGRRGKS